MRIVIMTTSQTRFRKMLDVLYCAILMLTSKHSCPWQSAWVWQLVIEHTHTHTHTQTLTLSVQHLCWPIMINSLTHNLDFKFLLDLSSLFALHTCRYGFLVLFPLIMTRFCFSFVCSFKRLLACEFIIFISCMHIYIYIYTYIFIRT